MMRGADDDMTDYGDDAGRERVLNVILVITTRTELSLESG